MKKLFALLVVALMFTAPVIAQEGDTIFMSGDSMIVMVPDSAMADSAMMDSAAVPAPAPVAEEATAAPLEDTVEVTGARQQIKLRIIEGGVLFMSFVVLCLIFGLALAIERIIYLNMATTNTKVLMDKVKGALEKAVLTRRPPFVAIPVALLQPSSSKAWSAAEAAMKNWPRPLKTTEASRAQSSNAV